MNDLQVLGLNEMFTREELKKAFRKKAVRFHPDRNSDNLDSHLAMIRLNRAYANLLETLNDKAPATAAKQNDDPAYSIYREGIARFQSIHPSKWKSVSMKGTF